MLIRTDRAATVELDLSSSQFLTGDVESYAECVCVYGCTQRIPVLGKDNKPAVCAAVCVRVYPCQLYSVRYKLWTAQGHPHPAWVLMLAG